MKVKIAKKQKRENVVSEMDILEESAAPKNTDENPEDKEATDSTQEDDQLNIDEQFCLEQKSEAGDSVEAVAVRYSKIAATV